MKTQQDFVHIRDVIKNYTEKNKRTQGEWIFSKYSTDLGIFSTTGTGNDIALVREYGSEEEAKANAEFICEAVNNYDKLKEENALLLDALKTIEARANGDWDNPLLIKHGFLSSEFDNDVLSIVKEAIQKAESK